MILLAAIIHWSRPGCHSRLPSAIALLLRAVKRFHGTIILRDDDDIGAVPHSGRSIEVVPATSAADSPPVADGHLTTMNTAISRLANTHLSPGSIYKPKMVSVYITIQRHHLSGSADIALLFHFAAWPQFAGVFGKSNGVLKHIQWPK